MALAHLTTVACTWAGSRAPTVKTTNGTISGSRKDGVAVFLGVPFAAPPVGALRLAQPETHPGWTNVRRATKAGPACADREDCLYLNAFTPEGALEEGGPPAPVFFYIHGGGFVSGSATTKADDLARLTGHAVFAIQYRLGVLGYYSTVSPPPNLGLQDQLLALRWVHENAAAFGGDTSRLMIFGCSAGGASVAGLLVNPAAAGLYHAAALESPGGHQGWMGGSKRADDDWMSAALNLNHSAALARELGCASRADLRCLQAVRLSTLRAKAEALRFAPSLVVAASPDLPGLVSLVARGGGAGAPRGERLTQQGQPQGPRQEQPEPEGELRAQPELEETYPLRELRRGAWHQVPVIVGGQSCESCGDAQKRLGPPRKDVTQSQFEAALVAAGFSGVNGSGVGPGPATLSTWYAARIAREGRWRTFARILSDSGHACSSTLHAEASCSSPQTFRRCTHTSTDSSSSSSTTASVSTTSSASTTSTSTSAATSTSTSAATSSTTSSTTPALRRSRPPPPRACGATSSPSCPPHRLCPARRTAATSPGSSTSTAARRPLRWLSRKPWRTGGRASTRRATQMRARDLARPRGVRTRRATTPPR